MTTSTQMQSKVDKTVTNMDRLDNFVNGGPTVTVATDTATLPSLANIVADIEVISGGISDAAEHSADAYTSSQLAATSAGNAANAATLVGDVSRFLSVLSRYYDTRAQGVAVTSVGDLFTSDETGVLLIYKRTSTTPFYVNIPGEAFVKSVNASGGTTGLSFAGGPITDIGTFTLTGILGVANGGTGANTAAAARVNLGAATAGANDDITSLAGLTTPLSVAQGGTGATTAEGARTNLGAASSGANDDITSLTGLTTPLSVAQGGTGATSAAGARTSLGAAAATDVIGVGQTWQAVARTLGTAYQNGGTRPITVAAAYQGTFQVSVNGTTWVTIGSFNELTTTTVIVPVAHYYRITGAQIQNVTELK